jgi:hypothetical protein
MLLTYALGRGTEYYDMPVVRTVAREAAPKNYRFAELVLGIVKSPPFQMRVKSPDAGKPLAAGLRDPKIDR